MAGLTGPAQESRHLIAKAQQVVKAEYLLSIPHTLPPIYTRNGPLINGVHVPGPWLEVLWG